jgi:hypothetical protein
MRSKSFIAYVACASAALVVEGCGAVPARVTYSPYSDQGGASPTADQGKSYVFRHRRSVLLVQRDSEGRYQVAPAPFELAADGSYMPLYEIMGADDFYATTQLKLSYADNTKFVDELQVSTKDNVADTIVKLTDIAKNAIPVFAAGETSVSRVAFKQTKIDPMADDVGQWHEDSLNDGLCLRLRAITVESHATLDGFVAAAKSKWVRTFPVPACATGIVDIASKCAPNQQETKAEDTIRVVYAHHQNVVLVPLPSSGSLKMHTVCGASVTASDKQDRTDVLDYVRNALKAANDVQSAIDSKTPGKAAPKAGKPTAQDAGSGAAKP